MTCVGVIGGMGPAATFDFCARFTAAMPAARDQDHPRLLVDCDPAIPDRNAAQRGAGPAPGPYLSRMARALVAAGADLLVMPCNAAHAYRADIEDAAPGRFIDMVAAATTEAVSAGAPVGVLAADGCRAAGLYQRALAAQSVACLLLEAADQSAFMDLVYRVKAGDTGDGVRRAMQGLAETLVRMGAASVIAGCTEAPLVLAPQDVTRPLVSSTDALVRATIAAVRARP